MLVDMTRLVLAAFVAVVLGMTAAPADARPLHDSGGTVAPLTPCARIVMADEGETGDCAVHVCRPHRHHHGHRQVARKHRGHRHHCFPFLSLQSGS